MSWKKVAEIENVTLEKFNGDRLCHYSKNNGSFNFIARRIDTLETVFTIEMERDFNYRVFNGFILFSCDNKLKQYDFEQEKLETIYSSERDYITIVNEKYFVDSKYSPTEKRYHNFLLDEYYREVPSFKGFASFQGYSDNYILCINPTKNIGLFDLEARELLWAIPSEQSVSGKSIFVDDRLILIFRTSMTCYDLKTGKEPWQLEDTFGQYVAEDKKLLGLNGNKFEMIDLNSGRKEMSSELQANVRIASHLVTYADGVLYFSAFINNNVPVLGAVNINTGNTEFIQQVNLDGRKSFRNGLGKPSVIENRLYVRGPKDTMHVFKKD